MPSNIDWNTSRNDSDSIAQNEKILKLFLQLATHTANRLTHLRKKSEKGYDCNRRNDTPSISTTEALITQSPSQTNLEWLDKSQKILNHSSSSDPEINSDKNQTVFNSQLPKLSALQNIDDNRDVERNLNLNSNLIPKSVQDVREASSDVTGHNHEFNSNTLQKSILDSDTSNNSLNVNEFRPDFLTSAGRVNQALIKNNTNTSIMNNLTETVNTFFPNSQNLQESTLEISQRLFDTDLAQIIPKIISNVHGNANQYIPSQNMQNIQASSDKNDDIRRSFFDPVILTNTGNMNTQTGKQKDNLPVVNEILSNTKNIVESMIKVLPETAKGASNLLSQVIPQSQDINTPLKSAEESQNHLAQSDYTQQEQSENAKQVGNQFDAGASGRNNQETRVNDLPTNENNSTAEDSNKQSTLLKDSSIPLFRFLSNFNELENNNNKTKIDFSSIQTNENANSSVDKELSIKEKSKLTDVAVTTSVLPNQIESNTLTSITEHQAKRSNDVRDSKNMNDVIKSDSEDGKNLQDNSSTNDRINRLPENQITHIDNLLDSNSYRSFIDNLKDEDLHVQLSEAKLQEISDQLINALRPIIEMRLDNNQTYVTDHYNKQ